MRAVVLRQTAQTNEIIKSRGARAWLNVTDKYAALLLLRAQAFKLLPAIFQREQAK